MKPISLIAAAIGMAVFASQPALADCVDVTGSVNKQDRTGIAKDGTHAPLEGNTGTQAQTDTPTGTTTTSADANAKSPQKDGTTMPMAGNSNLATSDQDVVAQQKGDKTAAATATQDKCD